MDGCRFRFPVLLVLALICGHHVGCGPAPRPVDEISSTLDSIPPAVPVNVANTDWPWWRGLSGQNVADCTVAPTVWNDNQNIKWKVKLAGRGHGSPTVVADRIYLCSADETAQKQFVVCLDRETGERLWSTEVHSGNLPGRREMHPKSTHANCTVACDGSSLFVGFLNGEHITATSLTLDGDIRWQRDLGYFGSKFGYAPSPCLFESLAIYAADNRGGGFIAAVHRDTGDIVWRKARNNVDTYSSAIVAEVEGVPRLLISGDNRLAAYDPLTGDELWSCAGTAEATCGTVVWDGHRAFASGGYPDRQTICVDMTTGEKLWDDNVKCYEQSMVVVNGFLYAVNDDGIAMCRDAETGQLKWRERLSGPISASPVVVGNLIYATNELGTTWIFEANSAEFKQIAKNQLGSESFASLVICDSRIYARVADSVGDERQEYLYCLEEAAIE